MKEIKCTLKNKYIQVKEKKLLKYTYKNYRVKGNIKNGKIKFIEIK